VTAARAATNSTSDDLVKANLALVGHIVRDVLNRVPAHVSRDDLISAGMYALAVSASSFDSSRGVPFARFAAIRIRGAVTDELRNMDWASRGVRSRAREIEITRTDLHERLGRRAADHEVAQVLGVAVTDVRAVNADVHRANVLSLQAITADGADDVLPSAGDSPEGVLLRREQIGFLHDAIAELPERLRVVIQQYFFEQRRMSEIAAELGVTESRVSQLRAEALALLQVGFRAADGTAETAEPAETATAPARQRARGAAHAAYAAAVSSRSTLAARLSVTSLLGETHLRTAPLATAV
jgi:RNA polymerase sigma factor for flagellar operon FliA